MTKGVKRNILWITRTAIFIALLIAGQALTQSMGQLVTGSYVNLILIATALSAGMASGLTVAIISPIVATALGIGPLWAIVPVIMLGNAVLVLIYALILRKGAAERFNAKGFVLWPAAILSSSAVKFAVMYLGVVKIVLPIISSSLKAPQIEKMTIMFAFPQLFTALIGGGIAMFVVPAILQTLKKARA